MTDMQGNMEFHFYKILTATNIYSRLNIQYHWYMHEQLIKKSTDTVEILFV